MLLFCILLVFTSLALAASPPANTILLGETAGSAEIVRCHFDEGRIVIRLGGELHVLRKGGALKNSGLSLIEITPEAATLAIRQSSPLGSLRLIRITGTTSGALLLREFATDPEALTSTSAATSRKVPISASAPAKPNPVPDGD